jgi:hypothetical protein
MDKVLEVLIKEGWEGVEIGVDLITGTKDSIQKRALIVKSTIDLEYDCDFLLIPYEDDYLIYKVST